MTTKPRKIARALGWIRSHLVSLALVTIFLFVGLFIGDVIFDDPLFHRREMTLFASRNSLSQDFTNIIRWMEEGNIDVDKWITHRADFDDLPNVFEEWLNPESKVIKAMVSL